MEVSAVGDSAHPEGFLGKLNLHSELQVWTFFNTILLLLAFLKVL